jgi:hypothetical protein
VITINFRVMKDGMKQLGMKSPIYVPGPVEPQFGPGRYIYFEGFSVDEHGKQHYMDTSVAYRQTSLRAIEYLRRFGYDDYQSYLLLGCAPVQGHVAGIVDVSLWSNILNILSNVACRFRMLAPQWVFQSTFLTSTSRWKSLQRRRTEVHVLLPMTIQELRVSLSRVFKYASCLKSKMDSIPCCSS